MLRRYSSAELTEIRALDILEPPIWLVVAEELTRLRWTVLCALGDGKSAPTLEDCRLPWGQLPDAQQPAEDTDIMRQQLMHSLEQTFGPLTHGDDSTDSG